MTETPDSKELMPTRRLETLVDGIFAIAMTLLVLNLALPRITGPMTEAALLTSLYTLMPNFYAFAMSFILLAMFWNINHRLFNRIKFVDEALLWINAVWLLFIAMAPFSTALVGQYGQFKSAQVVFNLNMLGIALFLFFNWHYAIRKHLIHEDVGIHRIAVTKRVLLAFIFFSLLALSAVWVIPRWNSLLYLLVWPAEKFFERHTPSG